MLAVMVISFALSFRILKSLWIAKIWLFMKILFQKILNYQQKHHNCPKNNLLFLK